MRIIQLQATNVKRIKAVDLTLKNGVVTVSGLNTAGKSSLVDSIYFALGGKEALPGQPVRKGQDKATIRLGLGTDAVEIVVKRTIPKDGTPSLTVESPDGARYPSPQAMLDALWTSLAVDPLHFTRMLPKEQAAMLRKVAKLEIDVDAIDALNKADYDLRTTINRDAKAKKLQTDGINLPTHPGVKVDDSALVDELQLAGEKNAEIETRKTQRATAEQAIQESAAQVASATKDATFMRESANKNYEQAGFEAKAVYDRACKAAGEALKRELDRAEAMERSAAVTAEKAEALRVKLADAPALPAPIDVTELRARISKAQETNRAVDAYAVNAERKQDLEQEYKALETQSKALTAAIDGREQQKADAIKGAAMPVEGLGFENGEVTYQGLPFDQASQAEQLRVSMAIALAANPKLRVVCIREGSLLDDKSLALIAEMAEKAGAQVFLEKVDGSGKIGIVIEDGEVASTPESRQAELEVGQ